MFLVLILVRKSYQLYIFSTGAGVDSNLLALSSYNCKSFGDDKLKVIRKLVKDSTFLLIQEHWQYDRQFLDKVNAKLSNVDCIISSPMDENTP